MNGEKLMKPKRILDKWLGKFVLVSVKGEEMMRFGILKQYDDMGILIGAYEDWDCNEGFIPWRIITNIDPDKESNKEEGL